jgi:hypothetical protein
MGRMKITLRDLFWLILVVGMALGWWLNSRRMLGERRKLLDERHFVIDSLINHLNEVEGKVTTWTTGKVQIGDRTYRKAEWQGKSYNGAAEGFR